MLTSFETSGDIRDVDLLAALVALWRERGHGSVSFIRGGASAAFEIADGDVVSVSSSEARFESSAILVRASKLDAAALERLAVPEGTDGALAALQAGILTRREWRWGEKIRAIEVLADLLGWADGKYYFDADARPSGGEFRLTIPRLILELFLRSRDRNLVEHQLGASDAPLVRAGNFESEFSTFGLTADAESVVRLIDGRATADEIARSAPADDFAVRKLLAALTTLGLIRAEGAAEPPAAPILSRAPAPAAAPEIPPRDHAAEVPAAQPERYEPVELPPSAEAEPQLSTRAIDVPPSETPAWDLPAPSPRSRRSDAIELDAPPSPLEAFALPAGRGSSEAVLRDEPPPGPSEPETSSEPGGFESLPSEPSRDVPGPPRGPGLGKLLLGVLALLVVGIAAVLFFRSRPVTTDSSAVVPTAVSTAALAGAPSPLPATAVPVAAAPTAAPAPTRIPPSPVPSRAESRVAEKRSTKAPAAAPTRAKPAAAPAPAKPAAREPESSAGAAASRSDWSARAERDRKRLARDRSVRYAIQLELACEAPSLVEAWKHDQPPGTMWLLTTKHGSRDCFRVLWGRYPSLEAAKRAKAGIPGFFTTASNRPAVVSVR